MISKLEYINNTFMLDVAKVLRRTPFIKLKYKKKFNHFRHAKVIKSVYNYFLASMTNLESQSMSKEKQNKIWVFWWQGKENMPEIVNLCYESLVRNMSGNVVLVTKENFKEYTDIPEYILEKVNKSQISLTHFSDIMRFNLLKNNGGLWVDATVFWTNPLSYENYEYLYTCGGYSSEDLEDFFVTRGKWTGFLIGGKEGNPLFVFMDNFFREYWKENIYLIDYFLIDYALRYAYEKNIGSFKEYVDTVAEGNNPQLFELSKLVNKPYNEEKISQLTKDTIAFKLSYKRKIELTPGSVMYKLTSREK